MKIHFKTEHKKAAYPTDAPLSVFQDSFDADAQKGSILFYIFMAIGLLTAMTLAFVHTPRDQANAEQARQLANRLYQQAHYIQSAIAECANSYPDGGGDLDGDGDVDSNDNDFPPYPLEPHDVNNPETAAASGYRFLDALQCPGAPSGSRFIFDDIRYQVPEAPHPFQQWRYINDADSVSIYVAFDPASETAMMAAQNIDKRYAARAAEVFNPGGTAQLRIHIIVDDS